MEWVEPLAWPGATVVMVCFGLYVLRKPIGRFIDRTTGFEKTAAGFRVEAAKRVEEITLEGPCVARCAVHENQPLKARLRRDAGDVAQV